jgi:Spy/CpxP family protein refolding chaperone
MKTKLMMMMATAAVSAALAQPPQSQPQPPSFDPVKTYLQLTDAQVTALQQIQQQVRQANQAAMQEIRTKHESLRTQLQAGNASAAAVGQLMIDIENLQKRIRDSMTSARNQAVNTLTDAQKTRLAALDAAARLFREIGQARALNLLAPPENDGNGPGPRSFGRGGPGRPGRPNGPGGPAPQFFGPRR